MRRWRLNSGYCGTTDQRRTQAGTIPALKHYMERDLGLFSYDWTPSLITTALWLDAADSSTITLNGNNVSQWNDKSGNGRNATQSTAANQPTYLSSEINGLAALDWDGSNDSMTISGGNTKLQSVLSQNNTNSVAMVIKPDLVSNLPVLFHEPTNTFQFLIELNSSAGIYWGQSTNAYRTYTSGAFGAVNTPSFFVLVKTGSTIGDAYLSGNLISTYTGNFGSTPTMTADILLGSFSTSSYNYNGKFAEIIVATTSWDTDTRQKVEGYLAHKWGLTTNLPADHPYKNAKP